VAARLLLPLHHPLRGLHAEGGQAVGLLPALPHHHRLVLHMVHRGFRRRQWMGDGRVELQERSRSSHILRSNHVDYDVGHIAVGGSECDTFLEEAGKQ